MVRADRTKNALYMRGTDAPHHIHVTELGESRYVGIAVHAASMEDLEKISRVEGASSIEDIDEPGGGKRVRLTDPDGYRLRASTAWRSFFRSPCRTPRAISAITNNSPKAGHFQTSTSRSQSKRLAVSPPLT